jgi:Methyltransferase domain
MAKRSASAPALAPLKRLVRPIFKNDGRIPLGSARWGDFRRGEPICSNFGYSRGKPIDRYYVERFLADHADDVFGRVLEIKDAGYTRKFGGSRVERSDVLDYDADNASATIVANLNDADALEEAVYDCAIITQTLHYLFEPAKALSHIHRSLKPGGVLLLTVPGLSPIRELHPWYWNFTARAVERLLSQTFGPTNVHVRPCGNVVSAIAFLQGLSAGELSETELGASDPAYQLLIVARAVKAHT